MNIIYRFFYELFHPKFKCARVGHKKRFRIESKYEYPSKEYRSVADRATYDIWWCRRCCAEISRNERVRDSLQGLTMPSSRWEALRRDGSIPA